jgi:hypothetical protein
MVRGASPRRVRRAFVVLALLLPLAGCLAGAAPARETLIENVAPLPIGSPGVVLRWDPQDDPVRLAPGDCATIPWIVAGHALARPANVSLALAATSGLEGRVDTTVAPPVVGVSGDALANGTARVCASPEAAPARGSADLVASAEGETVGVLSVRVEIVSVP